LAFFGARISFFFDFFPFFSENHRFLRVLTGFKIGGLRFRHREEGFTAKIYDGSDKIATAIAPPRNTILLAVDCSDLGNFNIIDKIAFLKNHVRQSSTLSYLLFTDK